MLHKNNLMPLLALCCTFLMFSIPQTATAIEAVASIKATKGTVDVLRNRTTLTARTGLILHDRDLVTTYQRSKATIIFRDGSEIRLFGNTKFLIEKSKESETGPRRFLNDFILKVGSFWGKFTKSRQRTVIKTPTATAGVKGTTFAMAERDAELDIALSTGALVVSNQTESIDLTAGKLMRDITAKGTLQDKVSDLTQKITILADENSFEIPEPGKTNEIGFTLQLVNTKTNKNVDRSGEVYISLTTDKAATDKIIFPETIVLNSRGYARIKATIESFESIENAKGRIEVFAVMDNEQFIDVAAGSTSLTYMNRRFLKIDASSGTVE